MRLEAHRFGLYRNFKRFRLRDLGFVRPAVFFRLFYPLLALIGVAAALFVGIADRGDPPSCKTVPGSKPQVIQCGDTLIVDGRVVEIVPSAKPRP